REAGMLAGTLPASMPQPDDGPRLVGRAGGMRPEDVQLGPLARGAVLRIGNDIDRKDRLVFGRSDRQRPAPVSAAEPVEHVMDFDPLVRNVAVLVELHLMQRSAS